MFDSIFSTFCGISQTILDIIEITNNNDESFKNHLTITNEQDRDVRNKIQELITHFKKSK